MTSEDIKHQLIIITSIQTILVLFELALATWSVIKQTSDTIWVVCNKLTTVWAPPPPPRRSKRCYFYCGSLWFMDASCHSEFTDRLCRHHSLIAILPSTTAVFSFAIGSRKLSANEQFLVGTQTVVSLLQTTQIISNACFITDHVAYASSNKTKIVWIETELFFLFSFLPGGGCVSCLRACLGARLLPQSY